MAVLYAFCREVDDVVDEDSVPVADRRIRLGEWRQDLQSAYSVETPRLPVMRELQPVIGTYGLQREHFEALLDGVEMDLNTTRYRSQEDLELYCYRVASVVGLLSIRIFGYRNPKCHEYAVFLGKALQLTNILRDVATDAQRGRIYLPTDDLARFGVSEADILGSRYSNEYRALAACMGARAREFYRQAHETLPSEDRRSMIAAELMGSVYWSLLQKLQAQEWNVFGPRPTRLTKLQKLLLMASTWRRITWGASTPNYGLP